MDDLTTHEAPVGDVASPRPVRHRRWVWSAIVATIAAAVVVAVVVARPSSAPPAGSAVAPPVRAGVLTAPAAPAAAVRDAVRALLQARAAAVLARDPRAFRATDATTPEARFDPRRLAALPIRAWSYDLDGVTATADATRVGVTAALRYRLAGDAREVWVPLSLSAVEQDGRWRVAAEATTGARRLPWELGVIRVARGAHSLVIGVGVGTGDLRQWASVADTAVAGIRAVVPTGWTPRVTLVVPGTTADVAALSGRDRSGLEGFAGFALAEPGAAGGSGSGAYRIYLNTPLLARTSPAARLILLRHEISHVALGAPATDATPLWLEEGVAEYLGYRGSGVALPVATRDLAAAVRAGYLPRALPAAGSFSGPRAMVAYEAAHLLCQTMVDRVGLAGLLRAYRLTARSGTAGSAGDFTAAWHEVAGQGVGGLITAWQARVRAVAR